MVKVNESSYKILEFNGAPKYGRYEKNWLKNLPVKSNVKVLATQDRRPDERDSLHRYRVTHTDQKVKQSSRMIKGARDGTRSTIQEYRNEVNLHGVGLKENLAFNCQNDHTEAVISPTPAYVTLVYICTSVYCWLVRPPPPPLPFPPNSPMHRES